MARKSKTSMCTIGTEYIVLYATKFLTRPEKAAFEVHVLTCGSCQERLGQVREELADQGKKQAK